MTNKGLILNNLFCSIPEALKMTGISRTFLYERLADGSIRAVKAGAKTLIDVQSLTAWAASLPTATFKPVGRKV